MILGVQSPFIQPVTSGVMCMILDSSFDPELLQHLFRGEEASRPTCIPLFTGTPYADLQAAGPYVVMCPAKSTSQVFAETLLGQADAGCLAWLSDPASLDEGVEHWRSLLTVRTDEEPQQMMRFFDPRWLEPLLLSLDESEKAQFIGPFSAMAWRNEMGWRQYAKTPSPPVTLQPPGWLYLSAERQSLIEQSRLKVIAARFAEDYEEVLPAEDTVAYVHRQLLAGQDSKYVQMADQERWLRLAIRHGDGFWMNSPYSDLLGRADLALGDKLSQLESL